LNTSDEHVASAEGRPDIRAFKGIEKLGSSEQQFRLLVESVSDYAIYMLGPDGEVSTWNAGAQRIKGYAPEEIIGQNFSRFYTEEDRAADLPKTALETARREGRFEREGWRVRKDGTRFWANVVVDPIRGPQGDVVGFAKITRDITERRDAQKAYDELREQLAQSQKMEAIGRLTGGIAHDFNNLLMAIQSSLELLRKRVPDDPAIHRLLDNATQGTERGSSLTQRMLAFARRQELAPESVDPQALVNGMTDLLQRSLGPSITLTTDFPPELAPVYTDPNQLESAVLNLAVNASDAMPAGGTIVIAAREETLAANDPGSLKPARYVVLSVKDHGEGMSEETLARAPEPFFTTKGVGKGTGLGLSMVQGLTEQSGGRLVIKSRRHEGTTVEIWLPVSSGTEPGAERPATPAPEPADADRKRTVLVVDDDFLVRINTVAMLEDLGHAVFEASSGKEALEILHNQPAIDVVVSDQAMPQMTGTQLATAIREDRPEMPIILATGYAELPPGSAGQDLPRLNKPFSQSELAKTLADTLRAAADPA
jgi:PAS domain S-box-containing protein